MLLIKSPFFIFLIENKKFRTIRPSFEGQNFASVRQVQIAEGGGEGGYFKIR